MRLLRYPNPEYSRVLPQQNVMPKLYVFSKQSSTFSNRKALPSFIFLISIKHTQKKTLYEHQLPPTKANMPSLFGIVIPKSLMLLFAYTILLAPLLGFTSAEVTHNPAALPADQLVSQAAQIKVDNFTQAINSLIHHQHQHHHNENRHNHAFNISARNDPALYAARVIKGRQLYCTMMDSLALTTQKNGGVSQEALINDPGNLYTEGFRTYVLKADDEHGPVFGEALDEPLNFLGSDVWESDEPMPVLVREAYTAKGFSQIDTLDPEIWHDSSRLVEVSTIDNHIFPNVN